MRGLLCLSTDAIVVNKARRCVQRARCGREERGTKRGEDGGYGGRIGVRAEKTRTMGACLARNVHVGNAADGGQWGCLTRAEYVCRNYVLFAITAMLDCVYAGKTAPL